MSIVSLSNLNVAIILILSSLFGLYFYLTRNLTFWKKRGIDGPKPILFFGTFYQIFFKSWPDISLDNTKKYGKIHGIFVGHRPILVLAEPQLVKDILMKDFHIFVDRNDFVSGDPMNDRSLFNLMGDEWKRMRSIISPTFSSGKMRRMHPIIVDCVKRLDQFLETLSLNEVSNECELKEVMSKLAMDVIATCAFGTRIDVYNVDKKSQFIEKAETIFKPSPRLILFFLMNATFPRLAKWLRLKPHPQSVEDFFRSALNSIIERRKSENREYSDYLQLMLNAKNKTNDCEEQDIESDNSNEVFGQTNEYIKSSKGRGEITEMDLLSTSFLFFFAGYETTASLLSYLFYCLALNEKCQQKLYEEINKYKDKLDYESISQMPYLEACVAETLRIYNPVPQTGRQASEDYTIDTGITIPKGVIVNLDIQTLYHSPEYYPDPERWDPLRFMPENRDKLVPYTYMPFGIGPRNCVGMRFALMEAKTAIAYLVNRFEFFRTRNTKPLTKPKKFHLIVNYGDLKVGDKLRNKT